MREVRGFTLIEVIIALAVVGIIVAAVAALQLQSVGATATSRQLSLVKAEANLVLEELLEITTSINDDLTPKYLFSHYYGDCSGGADVNGGTQLDCSGSAADLSTFNKSPSVESFWSISEVPGATTFEREGVMLLTVTSSWQGGAPEVTLGSAITCFNFFDEDKAVTPQPCPEPADPS